GSRLRRHPVSFPRPEQGHRSAAGAHDELHGIRRQHPAHRVLRLAPMVNRIVVGAHYGLGSWLAQRITAVIMAVYSVILLVVFMSGRPISYGVWKDLFSQGWMRVATLILVVSLPCHACACVRAT